MIALGTGNSPFTVTLGEKASGQTQEAEMGVKTLVHHHPTDVLGHHGGRNARSVLLLSSCWVWMVGVMPGKSLTYRFRSTGLSLFLQLF
jgi:hypothetical protein